MTFKSKLHTAFAYTKKGAKEVTNTIENHVPVLVSDLINGNLPELEAALLTASRRIAPGLSAAAVTIISVIRRKHKRKC